MLIADWAVVLRSSLQGIWYGVADFLPKLLLALLVFLVGWLIGAILEKGIAHGLHALKLDKVLKGAGLEKLLSKGGFKLDSGLFIGALVKWFVIIVFLVASLDILGLSQVTQFLREVVLTYLPNVFVAAFILLIGAVLADLIEKVVEGAAKAAGIKAWNFVGSVARWAIWIFAIIISLAQLGIAPEFLQILFTGVIAMLALAGGLAFGLGGKNVAADALDSLKDGIKRK